MKKLLAILLSALLVVGVMGTAFAVDDGEDEETTENEPVVTEGEDTGEEENPNVIDEMYFSVSMPVCGTEVTDVNRADAAQVLVEPKSLTVTELELVQSFDEEELTGEPFTGTIEGGENYALLITLEAAEGQFSTDEMGWYVEGVEDYDVFVSFPSEDEAPSAARVAIVCTAEHDWGDWTLAKEPTEDEDGLWVRTCLGNPEHSFTAIAPAGREPAEPGTVGPVLYDITLELYAPICGQEVKEENRQEAVWVYCYPEEIITAEHCELVTDYDTEDPGVCTPFLGTVVGGEEYTALITMTLDEDHRFAPDVEVNIDYPEDVSLKILEQTEEQITLAATYTADHDWGDWYVETEPTDDEDGLWMRVCQHDPSHVETDVIPALTEPEDPDDTWDTDDPELFAATLEVMAPVCGDEVTEDNRSEAVRVYPWPEDTMVVERCELVTDFDPDDPTACTPFLGTVIGGEDYTFLLTIAPDEDHWFGEDMEIGFYEEYLYSWEILEQTEKKITLAVTFTAEHDWGDWYVETEPTDDEDGVMMRVCLYDPSHEETETIPAGTDPYMPVPETDSPIVPGGAELDRDVPNTGDHGRPVIWGAAALVSMAGLVALLVVWKKRSGTR